MRKPDPMNQERMHQHQGEQTCLERLYIQVYLQCKGLTEESLTSLPEIEANKIRREAALYASMKLAEEESKARFAHNIH